MGKSPKGLPANATDDVAPGLSAQDKKTIARMGRLLKSDAERGLKTRHLIGRVLNRQVGPPARRKAHGKRVLELYGAELGIAPSDLNRMGWFSHLFPDFSDLRTQHPEIDSWTRFKTELPDLKPSKGGKARQPVANPSNPALGGVARSLANLTSKLNGLDIRPAGAERQKLVDALRGLAEAASRRLRINVEVAVRVKESKPVVTMKTNRAARA
jgi:hypothetical protein